MRILWISAGILLAVIVAAFVGSSLWIGSYVRGDAFRATIAAATGAAFDSTAGFDTLRWTGSSVYSESATLKGNPGGALSRMEARQLRAEVNWRAAFTGVWRVDEISISRLDGEWGPAEKSSRSAEVKPTDNSKSPAGISALLPHRFELGVLKIGAANLALGGVRIADSAVTIKPDGAGWLFQGSGGELRLPWVPAPGITGFRVREQGGDYYLTEGNFHLGQSGKISASGDSTGGGRLQVTWEGVKTSDVLTGEWRKRLDGVLSGNAIITLPDRATGSFQLRDGRLENVPLQATVADFTGNPSFRRMPLQEVSGDFTYERGILQIRNFSAESKGLLRIEGAATLGQRGALEGHFQIGVSAQTLQWLPGSRERVFTTARNGYVWTELTVGGTLEKPTENLSARLATAMGTEVIEKGAGLIKETPAAAVEGVKGILDIVRPFVP
ncbi:MAG: hypothetical protein NTV93_05505 [Verrucomicrobia bacterium]|nr:hypothetical protein [Verrucomicrobiota bacterium]